MTDLTDVTHPAAAEDRAATDIVVGYDDSMPSTWALAWAAEEARRTHRRLRVLHAADLARFIENAAELAPEVLALTEAAARQVAQQGALLGGHTASRANVVSYGSLGRPGPMLTEASRAAGLVVLGSHGAGRLSGLLLGSTVSAVTGHASCPVVVVPREAPIHPGPHDPVVVAVDGSDASWAALRFAAEHARQDRAPLTILTAWRPPLPDTWERVYFQHAHPHSEPEQAAEAAADAVVAAAAEQVRLRHPSLVVETRVVAGPPAGIIPICARDAALLVVGARGRGGLRSWGLGSVSWAVVHSAICPVAVVRAGPAVIVEPGSKDVVPA